MTLFFWFVNFIPDNVYKVKAVFIMVLDRTTQIMATRLYHFTPNYRINISVVSIEFSPLGSLTNMKVSFWGLFKTNF